MTNAPTESALAAFAARVARDLGPDAINTSAEGRERYGEHTLPFDDCPPSAIVFPDSTDAVVKLVRAANEFRIPLYPISNGQSAGLGSKSPVRRGQVVVDLGRRMNRIVEVNEALGYCVVEPGVSFQAMHAELVRRGSKLMISPTAGPPQGSLLGNALDKGGGGGAYADHFGMCCGMEIVLGTGDLIRTGDGSLDAPEQLNWHLSKYSFGPALDGLFTQSNFGIVTRVGIWLMPRPPHVEPFFFTFPEDDDLGPAIDLIRQVKLSNFVPTMMRATNDLYLFASDSARPDYVATGRHQLADELRRELQARYRLGSWTVSGAFYGASKDALQPQVTRLRAHFDRIGRGRYIDPIEAQEIAPLHIALANYAGIPGEGELRMLAWRPGGGGIWFTPGTPMIGEVVNGFQRSSRAICAEHGFEYMSSNVCSARFARGVHAILFNRRDPDEAKRADACYRALSFAFAARGVFVGRAPTAYQQFHQEQRMSSMIAACAAIKHALDPNGVIAPGKYGIE